MAWVTHGDPAAALGALFGVRNGGCGDILCLRGEILGDGFVRPRRNLRTRRFGAKKGNYGAETGPFGVKRRPFGAKNGPFGVKRGPFGAKNGPFGIKEGLLGPQRGILG